MPADAGMPTIARSRAPTLFSVRMKSASAQKTGFWTKSKSGVGLLLSDITDKKTPPGFLPWRRVFSGTGDWPLVGNRYAAKIYFAGWLAYQEASPSMMALL